MTADEIKSIKSTILVKILLIAAAVLIIVLFIGNAIISPSNSKSFSSSDELEQSDDSGQFIREFLINHTFFNKEIGGTAYLTFTSKSGGWYGAMKMTIGACDFIYSYDLDDRDIKLTYSGSTCGGQGSSQTLKFNYDNSISIYIKGQKFVFSAL